MILRAAGTARTGGGMAPDTLVLGCTHYPLLRAPIEKALAELHLASPIRVIDSAEATAKRVVQALGAPAVAAAPPVAPPLRFFATDSVAKFRSLGTRFLGQPIIDVELVDLGG